MENRAYDVLIERLGGVNSLLDKELVNCLANGLIETEGDEKQDWAIFSQIFIELHECGARNYYNMFAYYFTGSSDHMEVMILLLSRMKFKTEEIKRLEGKLLGEKY